MEPADAGRAIMRLLGAQEETKPRFPTGKGLKAGVITIVGFAGVTAASAAISSLRRRQAKRGKRGSDDE